MKLFRELLEAAVAVSFISAGHAIAKGSTGCAIALVFMGWIGLRTLQTLAESH